MKKQQSGFTLIELMIVVAIIGILAAIAVPQYQNFMARSQAAESVVMLDGARTTVEDVVVSDGAFVASLATLADLGVNMTGSYGAISAISASGADGSIQYKISSTGVNNNIKDETIRVLRTDGSWSCKTSLPAKFAPKSCTPSS